MANVVLEGVTNRTFSFTVEITREDGSKYELQGGDELFFLVGERKGPDSCILSIIQKELQFRVKSLEIPSGVYEFEFGIKLANGDKYTIITRDQGVLKVARNVGDVE